MSRLLCAARRDFLWVPIQRRVAAMKGDRPETGIGGCLCGAVRFQAMGEPVVTGHCHCADCRRHNGAPVVTLVIFEADKVGLRKGNARSTSHRRGWGGRSATNAAPR